jgi:uncharacterized membrane protein YeaQ/YmgE (transglycosylase-associated protein family)
MNLVLGIICGAIGGNVAASLMRRYNLGLLGNTIAGIAGGLLGGVLVSAVLVDGPSLAALLSRMAGSGIGAGFLVLATGAARSVLR